MTLKQIRQRLMVSQEELAYRLDVSVVSVRRWETRSTPNYTNMHKIQSLCEKNGIKFKAKDLIYKKGE